MNDEMQRLAQLKQQGFLCSQIIMIEGLEMMGKQNPDLVRAMHPLGNGLGGSGEICGALTGAVCLLGLYAGRGAPGDPPDYRLEAMTTELVDWFKQQQEPRYGGIRCSELLEGDVSLKPTRCPEFVRSCLQKAKDLLVENGFELSGVEL
ncbi:MAG: DVU_1555 family C-GCAxxG-C-C protein [Chloroflexota bacterium]